ncbi:Wadjet anti-phage system protein JetD domain-containing protein [Stieleria varia]|uniref:Wadjet protein JetD C-terminal domain-containing protein n=1 Tax=Stieleria varia TaxID=2528005 RepID=A0A5C6ARS3_9BACT|nr:Wadjet anti-phage system protein JetD domain-containing protein [Stieleria varia]TWU02713.1 hypothetical protein Pla52n_37720 [Stieleria varia]
MRSDEITLLRKLQEQTDGVAESSLRKGTQVLVNRLHACGAVQWERGKSGRGRRLRISSVAAFDALVHDELPQGLNFSEDLVQDHASAVELRGDAKAFAGSIAEAVLLRTIKPGIVIQRTTSVTSVSISELSEIAGCAAISITDDSDWEFSGTITVIENADTFWRYELVLPGTDLAIYSAGRMSSRLLRWLASPPMQSCQILHWGDYDPVGIDEYIRLYDACGARVCLHVPDDINELILKYGKRSLIQSNLNVLKRICNRHEVPNVLRMTELFDLHHRGLEQEILIGKQFPNFG